MSSEALKLGIVGAGRVGTALATLWQEAGVSVVAVSSRSPERAHALAERIHARFVAVNDLTDFCNLIVICVPDDEIPKVALQLAESDLQGCMLVHTSGATPVSALDPARQRGAQTGGIHPVFAFTQPETARQNLPGATFALEASDASVMDALLQLVVALDGKTIVIDSQTRPLYHAALSILSNYTVTLYALAQRILLEIGSNPEAARQALDVLLRSTAANLIDLGIPRALTGPLARGDLATIRAHIEALSDDPELKMLYCLLAAQTLPIARSLGVNTEELQQAIASGR